MNLFKKKKLHPEDTYVVLPGIKAKALKATIKKNRLGKLDLKKDLAEYMHEHRHDNFDTRPRSAQSIANDIRIQLSRKDVNED